MICWKGEGGALRYKNPNPLPRCRASISKVVITPGCCSLNTTTNAQSIVFHKIQGMAMSTRLASQALRIARRSSRAFSSSTRLYSAASTKPPPFPVVPTCPSPTCDCQATPEMPDGLPIDHKGKLNGLISSYAEQVLICTGKDDWPSRIEDDNSGDNLAADLKELFGRGGVYSDVSETQPRRFFISGECFV